MTMLPFGAQVNIFVGCCAVEHIVQFYCSRYCVPIWSEINALGIGVVVVGALYQCSPLATVCGRFIVVI